MNSHFATWTKLNGLASFGFVFSGLALSGIPGWSRLAFVFVAMLAVLTVIDISVRRGGLGKWLLLPMPFFVLAIIEGLVRYPASHDVLVRFLGTWVGVLLVAESVRRGVPVRGVINAMLFASIANAAASIAGFDAYYTYNATAEQQTYASILDRRSGLVGNANLLAVQAVLPLFASLIWGRGLSRVLVALGVACAIYAVLSTGSRKVLVLLMFLAAAACLRLPSSKRLIVLAAGSFISAAVAVLVIGSGWLGILEDASREVLAVDRIYQALEGRDESFQVRSWMIDVAQDLFFEKPFFGGGLGYFAEASGFGAYAHNNFWELAVAGGLSLLLAYYAIPASVFLGLLNRARHGSVESAAACMFIVALLVNDYGMVVYDEKAIVLMLVLLSVWVLAPTAVGMRDTASVRKSGDSRGSP